MLLIVNNIDKNKVADVGMDGLFYEAEIIQQLKPEGEECIRYHEK